MAESELSVSLNHGCPVPSVEHLAAAQQLSATEQRGWWTRCRRATAELGRSRQGVIGVIILAILGVIAIVGPWIAPQDPNAATSFSSHILASPSWSHWLGTDENGRDILSELIVGTRSTMLVGLVAAAVSSVIGTAVGVVSGYAGGWIDRALSMLDDWFLVLPLVPVTVLAAALLGQRADSLPMGQTMVLILVIGIFGWAGTSRVVRAEVLSLKRRAFVERSVALGASNRRIITRDILPNVFPLVLANAIIYVSLAILTESTLSYLGVGDPNSFSWGHMLDNAQNAGAMSSDDWTYFMPPGICITVAVLGFSLLGTSVEHLTDPRRRERR